MQSCFVAGNDLTPLNAEALKSLHEIHVTEGSILVLLQSRCDPGLQQLIRA